MMNDYEVTVTRTVADTYRVKGRTITEAAMAAGVRVASIDDDSSPDATLEIARKVSRPVKITLPAENDGPLAQAAARRAAADESLRQAAATLSGTPDYLIETTGPDSAFIECRGGGVDGVQVSDASDNE